MDLTTGADRSGRVSNFPSSNFVAAIAMRIGSSRKVESFGEHTIPLASIMTCRLRLSFAGHQLIVRYVKFPILFHCELTDYRSAASLSQCTESLAISYTHAHLFGLCIDCKDYHTHFCNLLGQAPNLSHSLLPSFVSQKAQ